MTTPASGAISLNQIHIEAGGSSGTSASINDSDIRALISKGSGVSMSFSEWYGASSSLDSDTMTAGSATILYQTWSGFQNWYATTIGSMAGTFSPKSAAYAGLWHINGAGTITFRLHGAHTNAGWTSMTVAGSTYTRTSASFTQTGGDTQWSWSGVSSSPFSSGTSYTVTWL